MELSTSLLIATWIWVILSSVAVIGCGALVAYLISEDEKYGVVVFLLCWSASIGFLYLSLSFIGHPVAAMWTWRILSGIACAFGVFCCVWVIVEDGEILEILSMFGGAILAIGLMVASILSVSRPLPVMPQSTTAQGLSEASRLQINGWHTFALAILATATLIFVLLFGLAMRRGIPPGIESHWGGLGGGLTGLQISQSLTYLIAAIVFGILFAAFLLREENSVASGASAPMAKEATSHRLEGESEQKGSKDTGNKATLPPGTAPVQAPTPQ
jgi:hypothetical protein